MPTPGSRTLSRRRCGRFKRDNFKLGVFQVDVFPELDEMICRLGVSRHVDRSSAGGDRPIQRPRVSHLGHAAAARLRSAAVPVRAIETAKKAHSVLDWHTPLGTHLKTSISRYKVIF
jgi:hypothetical protein